MGVIRARKEALWLLLLCSGSDSERGRVDRGWAL